MKIQTNVNTGTGNRIRDSKKQLEPEPNQLMNTAHLDKEPRTELLRILGVS